MSDEIFFDGVRYVSASEAAFSSGFTRDYIARLCKEGKLEGKRVGKQWYVSPNSVKDFLVKQEYARVKRCEELSHIRQNEYNAQEKNPNPFVREEATNARTVTAHSEGAFQNLIARVPPRTHLQTVHALTSVPLHAASIKAHASAQLFPPALELFHKFIAASIAILFIAGTFVLVDAQYARITERSISGSAGIVRAVHGQLLAAASNPAEALSTGIQSFAKVFNTGIDSIVYGIMFPRTLVEDSRAKVVARVLPRPVSQVPGNSLTSNTFITQPVIERLVSTAGGITEEILNAKLAQLQSSLVERKIFSRQKDATSESFESLFTSLGESFTTEELAVSGATTLGTLRAGTSTLTALTVNGTATSTFANGIDLQDGCFAIDGVCVSGGGGSGTIDGSGSADLFAYFTDADTLAATSSPTVGYLTATSTTASVFPYASSTALSVSGTGYFGTASTTNLTVSSLQSSLLSTNGSGVVQGATVGNGLAFSGNTLSTSFGTTTSNTWTALQLFSAGASTSRLSVFGQLFVGGTATSTFDSSGNLNVPGTITVDTGIQSGGGFISSITGSDSQPAIRWHVDTNTGISKPAEDNLAFITGGTQRVRINASGDVGIGTSSPYSRLSVWGGTTGNIFEAVTSASSSALTVSATGFGTTTVTGLTVNGSATSTSNVGFNLSGGCFAVNGICVGGSSASTTLLADNNTFSGNNIFSSVLRMTGGLLSTASSTIGGGTQATGLTISGGATTTGYLVVQGAATSTFADGISSSKGINAGGYFFGANLTTCTGTNKLTWSNGSFSCDIDSTGGGSGGGSWSTTTSQVAGQLINYSNNSADIITIGSNATTSAEYWFDPNSTTAFFSGRLGIGTTSPFASLSVAGNIFANGTITGSNITATGTLSVSGNTTLANATSTSFAITNLANSLLSTNANGSVVATTSVGASYITGTLGTVNGTTFNRGDSITISAASSTLLANNNTWTGANIFSGNVTLTNATSSNFAITNITSAIPLAASDGSLQEYAGTSCTNQFVRSLNGAGVSTCASVQDEDLNLADITLADFTNDADYVKWASATSSLWRSAGLLSTASSTIGAGAQDTGLTISGGATTTGNAYFGGSVGIGVAPDIGNKLQIQDGNFAIKSAAVNRILLAGDSSSPYIELFNIGATRAKISTLGDSYFNGGNVGIGTTSPYAKLSVAGQTVSEYFTATSTTATSTFAAGIQSTYLNITGASASSTFANGINLAAGCFAVNGTCVTGGGATPAGSGTEFQYRNGSALGAVANSAFSAGGGYVSFGTTTSSLGVLTLGSSTAPQLLLSDNSGNNLWALRSVGNSLYFATSTASATSTVSALSFNGTTGAATFGSSATTTFTGGIQGTALNLTGSATSTAANGINLAAGCFSINGSCIGSGGSGSGGGQLLATYATSSVGTSTVNFLGSSGSAPSYSGTTLTLPSNTSYVVVEVWGGGGGGAGSAGTGGTASASNFGGTATSTGGAGGVTNGVGGAGGAGSGGDINVTGSGGGTAEYSNGISGFGGNAPRGGAGGKNVITSIAGNAGSTYGGGGGGAGYNGAQDGVGGGGGGGGYTQKLFTTLASSYQFVVGAGGAAGSGTNAGGTGGTGGVVIYVYTTGISNGSLASGTAGQFAFWDTAGTNLSATSSLFVATNGNIGVGSTTPWAKLSVQANAGQTNPVFEVASSSAATAFLSVSGTGFGTTTVTGLTVNGSATSTSNVGFNLSGGCFAVNGVCVGGGSGGSGVWPFTPSSYGGVANQSTTTPLWLNGTQLIASSTLVVNATTTGATTTSFAVSSITSALPLAGADGSFSEYAGTSCTNQFVRSLNGAGVATCASVQDEDLNLSDITLADFTNDAGFAAYAFTTTTHFGTTTSATSTPLFLRGNLYSLFASSTSVFQNASTTLLSIGADTISDIDGDALTIVSGALNVDDVTAAMLASADFGEFTCNGTTCSLDSDTVSDSEIDYSTVTLADFTNDGDFVKWASATSSLWRSAGLLSTASSTIGGGTQASGLTISGGATTTGFLVVQGAATSTFAAGLQAAYLNLTGSSATSTAANGLNLSAGCFSIAGVCVGGGGGSGDITAVGNISSGDAFTSGTPGAELYFSDNGFLGLGSAAGRIEFDDLTVDEVNIIGANVGIGTSSPYAKLSVWGSGTGTGKLFELVNNASTTIASFLDNGTAFILGNLGIGSTSPTHRLTVTDGVSTAQTSIAYDATRYTTLLTDASGDLIIDPEGPDSSADELVLLDDNLLVCNDGCESHPTGEGKIIADTTLSSGSTTPDTNSKLVIQTGDATTDFIRVASTTNYSLLVLDERGFLGIGTSTPTQQLSIANKLFVANGTPASAGTATSTFLGDVLITGKLDVSTIDPVYTIDGVKYATYGHSTVGVKEEAIAIVGVTKKSWFFGKYEYTIDFDELKEGSDLWLFYQVSDFGAGWNNLAVSATAGFDGTVSYKKNDADNTLTIMSSAPGEVSLRLIADRFDAAEWPNLRPDQNEGFPGFEISSKK